MKAELCKWLNDIGQKAASDFLNDCSLTMLDVDSLFELGTGEYVAELMDAKIGVPAKYYLKLKTEYSAEVSTIENQFAEVGIAIGIKIRNISWNPKIETEIEKK